MSTGVVLHVSPHPDDEALGSPATLIGLRDAGWHVINALVSLGRPADRHRRSNEARDAAARGRFELLVPSEPFGISGSDDLSMARQMVGVYLRDLMTERGPGVVISPAVTDAHHGHRLVGQAVRDALVASNATVAWWTWSVWSELPNPSLYVPFDEACLTEVLEILGAYGGELARNPYDRLVRGRSLANTVLGSERLFGFGTPVASQLPYAELLSEYHVVDGAITARRSRILEFGAPLPAGDDR